jgi:Uncharacterized conserved protein
VFAVFVFASNQRAMILYNGNAMAAIITTLTTPLTQWEDGSIRVKGSRVTLDSIVHQFKLGATAEQILYSYPSLTLRDIYGAILYYLENTEAVEDYLREQEEAAEEGLRFIETHFDTKALRERMLARRNQPPKS